MSFVPRMAGYSVVGLLSALSCALRSSFPCDEITSSAEGACFKHYVRTHSPLLLLKSGFLPG